MPLDPSGPRKRDVYDQWVLDAFGVDPSAYPSLRTPDAAEPALTSLAPSTEPPAPAGVDKKSIPLPVSSSALLTPALFAGAPAEAAASPALVSELPAPPVQGLSSSGVVEAVGEGAAEAAGTVVLRFALGAVSFIATLVIPTNTQRSGHDAAVDGRPEMTGTVTTASGSRSGEVTIRMHGQNGQPDRELGTFVMDPDGTLTDGGQGTVLGIAGAGGVHLTPKGEKELLRRAGEGLGPVLGTQPASPAPSAPQQAGLGYDTRDQEEADLAASLAGQGKSGQEIQAALEEHRRNDGLEQGNGGFRSVGTSSGEAYPTQPTPQDGVAGGKPTGVPEVSDLSANQTTRDGIRIQVETGNAMAAAKYRVEWQPQVYPGDNIGPGKKPDMRLGNNIADVVAPKSSDVNQVRKAVSRKIKERQAYHIALNISRTDVTREQVESLLQQKPIDGLRELLVI